MPLCGNDNGVCPAQECPENGLVQGKQLFLLHHVAVPGDDHPFFRPGQQACQIRQRKGQMALDHVRLLCHPAKFPEKGKGNRTGSHGAPAAAPGDGHPIADLPDAPALGLAHQHGNLRPILQPLGHLLYHGFDAPDVGRIEFIHL